MNADRAIPAPFLLLLASAMVAWGPRSLDAQPPQSNSQNSNPNAGAIRFANPWTLGRFPFELGTVVLPQATDVGQGGADPVPSNKAPYVGPATCAECHSDQFDGFVHTSHYLTSRLANAETVMGSFEAPANRLATRQKQLHYRMDARPDGLYQMAVVEGRDVHGERMDITLGSGKLGQSYLFWRGDELFQLPVSHFVLGNAWMNSPGYPDGIAIFARPIIGRCLECHTTWFEARSDTRLNHRYAPKGAILGVTCERCHGPGAEHVAYHRAHPDEQEARNIIHPGELPRQRLFDVCGQCHGGLGRSIQPAFSFRPGNVLADHVDPGPPGKWGIHSNNQLQRLRESLCYQKSPRMSCATCHDPHRFERNQHALFAKRCRQCHNTTDCGIEPSIGAALGDHCSQCHMPRKPLVDIGLKSGGDVVFPEMVDHHIRTGVSDPKLEQKLRALSEAKP